MPFKYGAWFGVKKLPEIKEDTNGIVSGPKNISMLVPNDGCSPMAK
ncbi:MAG: hypothetical protein IPP71_20110 [Bacteroidetes bacterium]|nr:hypothetical protein [Bacteroidota bacterium]